MRHATHDVSTQCRTASVPDYGAFTNLGKNKDNEQLEALETCVDEGLIDEIHWVVKSGKEATVYLCEAAIDGEASLIAAKVFRSTQVRGFANDAAYRSGRMRGSEHRREARAISGKTRAGREMVFNSWVSDEYATLRLLHAHGADVPAPIAQRGNIVLMEYIGDDDEAAPTLAQARLTATEAEPLLARLLWNVELMLSLDRVHGDLSPFNVLYWDGRPRIIDFPQAVDARFNPNASELLDRDVDRICAFFARLGVPNDAHRIARRLWEGFRRAELDPGQPPPLPGSAVSR
jgi:RIO kinase 1